MSAFFSLKLLTLFPALTPVHPSNHQSTLPFAAFFIQEMYLVEDSKRGPELLSYTSTSNWIQIRYSVGVKTKRQSYITHKHIWCLCTSIEKNKNCV